jgi:hypothetical protein
MAKKQQDARAARERKQKIFLVVGGVLLLGLGAIQGPKLMKQVKGSSATPAPVAATSTAAPTGTAAPATSGTPAGPTSVGSGASASTLRAPKSATTQLAGVVIVPEQPIRAGTGQLQSLGRFQAKDPFAQQVSDKASLPTPAEVAGIPLNPVTPAKSGSGATGVPNAPGSSGVGTGIAPVAPATPTMAMLKVNGKLTTVDLKGRFPKSDKAFVLRSLKLSPGRATIAVADGSFSGNQQTLTLTAGHAVTLINTATGVRYVIRLLFVGNDPDSVAVFSAK